MCQDCRDRYGKLELLIDEMRQLSLADIRAATRSQRDEFERVARGIAQTISEENAHDMKAMIGAK